MNPSLSSAVADAEHPVGRLLLTPAEAAEALGIGRSELYELMRAGVVESVLIGTARRIPADGLAAYVSTLREHLSG
jgi:excisionase family DNA binding protein